MLSRLCLYFDQLLMLERAAMKSEVQSMFKNMFIYTYQSHLVLCFVIYNKLPSQLRFENKWAIFLGEVTKTKV